ncbi:hypothetical protein [Spirillospora sp. CA-294931]|uniref:hypothetical protein n=1 Tax=Spirillospora sp. CA-294931 TaxID=3240042 RepID=UPI003D89BE0A
MLRKLIVLLVMLSLVLTSACGSDDKKASRSGAGATASQAGGGTASPDVCPSEATKKFAKTRFVADAGLAFGAFHRWIYKPYKEGTFQKGAEGRTKAMVKAAAAGAFTVNRLNAARKMVNADPKLCGALKKPLDGLMTKLKTLPDKLKSGNINPAEIGSVGGAIDAFKSDASKSGNDIKERTPPNVGG